jgi:nitrogen fixation protein
MKKKTYMINHIPIKQVWLEENIILIKDVKKWVDKKLLKSQWKKRLAIIC